MDKDKMFECGCGDNSCEGAEHSCGCGCGCGEHEHEALVVDLEDEQGNVVTCEVIDGFEFNSNEYVLVQNPQDGSVYLFKIVGEGEEGELVIPEDKEFEEATAHYQSLCDSEK
ncbi:DUF1292 domain-containing protein [Clostridium rectalis]|uniref:DUF1292 domain-containing protein n=1 Tax=Clostridium rectalis TaxID=2040295 RepID=UPI000F62C472|nr:DUF1292 domain-containing protein [Clostridium rectalis]